jgi:hypothetical protein
MENRGGMLEGVQMQHLILKARAYLEAKVGRCTKCMRQSLAATFAAWTAYGIGLTIWPEESALTLIGLAAVGLTLLWVLHVAVYAARAVAKARRTGRGFRANGARAETARASLSSDQIGRRQALGVFLRAAGVSAAASIPVILWPARSFAYCGQCTKDDDCGGSKYGWCCKNTAPVNAGYVCNECVRC